MTEVAVPGIPAHRKIDVCRKLASGVMKRIDIARELGVNPSTITRFARANASLIDEMRRQATSEHGRAIVGLWITEQENRLAAYEADYGMSLANPRADHYEHIKARALLLKQAAEELGQLQTAMTVIPVTHVVVNVDLDALK